MLTDIKCFYGATGFAVDDGPNLDDPDSASRPEEAVLESTPEKGSLIVERGHVRYVAKSVFVL